MSSLSAVLNVTQNAVMAVNGLAEAVFGTKRHSASFLFRILHSTPATCGLLDRIAHPTAIQNLALQFYQRALTLAREGRPEHPPASFPRIPSFLRAANQLAPVKIPLRNRGAPARRLRDPKNSDLNVPLIVQPQLFSLFSVLSWGQYSYYGPAARSRMWCTVEISGTLVLWGALEAGTILAFCVRVFSLAICSDFV